VKLPIRRALALSLACLLAAAHAADVAPVRVPTRLVAPAAAGTAMTLDAVLQPVRQATVTAQVGGNVVALRVQPGDRVRRGQPLVRLDDREVRANTARSDAAVLQAEAELRNAQQVAERNRALKKDGFISQAAVDTADNQVNAAHAAVRQAQAARTQAAVAQGFAEVTAPFDAVVLATHVETGDLAMPGRALVTLYEPGRMRAVAQVSASRLPPAGAATEVRVVLADGQSFTPSARELLPTADPVSQTVEWRLTLPAAAAALRPGQTAQVQVRSAGVAPADKRLSLPASAVLRRGELTAVYVAGPQGFALRAVRVGPEVGGVVDVLSGLRAGERVATDPVRAGLQGAMPDGQ
jgi:RND family efflux transporter MFP subunit